MSAIAWSALSFFLGLLIGHWLALGRDKRKELNELGAPLRSWVIAQLSSPDKEIWEKPTVSQIDAFSQRLGKSQRSRFHRTWSEMLHAYAANVTRDPETGARMFTRTEKGLARLRVLEEMLRPR